MDVKWLQMFAEVMRRGSFAAVARDRDIDSSLVSRNISNLEAELGVRLFQRTTRRLSPTEAGQVYADRISGLIEELEQAKNAALDVSIEPAGTLRVTASVAFGQTCLVPLLPRVRRRYPDLSVNLALSDTNLDLIAEGIDLAIRLGPRMDTGLIGAKLFDTRYHVCASPDYMKREGPCLTPEDLSGRDCILFALPDYRSAWRFRDADGSETQVGVRGSMVISNALAVRESSRNGLGPALLADWMVDNDFADGTLVDMFPDYRVTATDFETAAWILYPSRAYLPLKTRVFIDLLRAELAMRQGS